MLLTAKKLKSGRIGLYDYDRVGTRLSTDLCNKLRYQAIWQNKKSFYYYGFSWNNFLTSASIILFLFAEKCIGVMSSNNEVRLPELRY